MIPFLDSKAGRVFQWLVGAALLVAVALAIGRMMPTRPEVGIAAALLVLALGVTAAEPAAIPLVSLPLLLVVRRVGVGGIDLSVSDAVLFLATLTVLVFAPRPFSKQMRTILWLSALYQFATLFTVVANPYLANVVEWFHAWMLVSGALLVGWTVGRAGYARHGLTLVLAAISLIAVGTIVQGGVNAASGVFDPVAPSWPFSMHKNFAGTVLGFGAVTAYVRPSWMGWSRRLGLGAFWLMAIGVLVTQSRQAIIALALVLLFVSLRQKVEHPRSKAIIFAVVPALILVGMLVRDQVEEGNRFSSVFQRVTWFQETLAFWSESPWFGHGLRYWYTGSGPGYQPPNAELEVLTSAGVVGLAAFLTLMIGVFVVLWRAEPEYGTLAMAVLMSRFIQSQFDLFWVAVSISVPFAIVGICLAAQALEDFERPPDLLRAIRSEDRVTA